MQAITKLKKLFDGGSREGLEYECRNCGTSFSVRHFTCPSCGSYSVERTTWENDVE